MKTPLLRFIGLDVHCIAKRNKRVQKKCSDKLPMGKRSLLDLLTQRPFTQFTGLVGLYIVRENTKLQRESSEQHTKGNNRPWIMPMQLQGISCHA
jgi:hypothetical protein